MSAPDAGECIIAALAQVDRAALELRVVTRLLITAGLDGYSDAFLRGLAADVATAACRYADASAAARDIDVASCLRREAAP